jgi:tetratricopeptide (TPR) repeat protein
MSEEPKDHYPILGVSRGASENEIHQAFRKLSRRYHAIQGAGRMAAMEKVQALNEAYEVLGDRKKRRQYDQQVAQAQVSTAAVATEEEPIASAEPAAVAAPAEPAPAPGNVAKVGAWVLRYLWIAALIYSVTYLTLDSIARLRAIDLVTNTRVGNSPIVREDPNSLTGYQFNQQKLVVPAIGTDGYHWMMQTDLMLGGLEGWRVRHTSYDDPPDGREVHWSSSLHWLAGGLAWLYSKYTGMPIGRGVTWAAPWANTFVLLVLMLVSVPVVARRFGSLPAALLALGYVVIYPYYEFYIVGYFDHHGIAASWDLFCVLCLIAGGAGWLRAEDVQPERLSPAERRLWEWLPDRAGARRWFIASAIAGGGGLWISAATIVTAMFGIGLGALLATGVFARHQPAKSPWRADPTLWRTWGIAGALASLFFYALEYMPFHFSWRLEVNHPLYALALLGAGDGLCRLSRLIAGDPALASPELRRKEWQWVGLDVAAVAVLPLAILIFGLRVFVIPDYFLWSLHTDYIIEFRTLFRQIGTLNVTEIMGGISLVPLLVFPLAALVWLRDLPRPSRALLALAFFPALVLLLLAFKQIRWLGIGCALWLGALVTTTFVLTQARLLHGKTLLAAVVGAGALVILLSFNTWWYVLAALALAPLTFGLLIAFNGFRWSDTLTTSLSICAGIFLALVLVPYPFYTIRQWIEFDLKLPVTQLDLTQVITRDAAYRIRQRLGAEEGVVVSGPTTTTWMMFWGGLKGVGTLYWENDEGLKKTAAIYSATSEDEAFDLVKKYGVTHIAIFSWDAFAQEYAKLYRGLRLNDEPPEDAFILQLLHSGRIPRWLRPLPYQLPNQPDLKNQYVFLLEVVPNQTDEEAAVRVAMFLLAQNKAEQAENQLRAVTRMRPDYLPALVEQARVQQTQGEREAFHETMEGIRANLAEAGKMELDERIDLAIDFAMDNDAGEFRHQIIGALNAADEKSLRHCSAEALLNFVVIANQLGLSDLYPKVIDFAQSLLPTEAEMQYQASVAASEYRVGHEAKAAALYEQIIAQDPNQFAILNNLGMLYATARDDSVRNPQKALEYARRAAEIDSFQHVESYDTLACAQAAAGNFAEAQRLEKKAVALIEAANETSGRADAIRARLALFEKNESFHE